MKFQDTLFSRLRRRYYTSANKVLRGSEADRKLDIFLTPTDAALPDGEHDWSNVLVIGEHKQNPDEDRSIKTLVQLAGYVREVFGSQPGRRFVPGFTICGSIMRLWMVDRSGAYSSEKFDIHKEPERFVKVIAELALNTFIKRDGNGKYIVARDHGCEDLFGGQANRLDKSDSVPGNNVLSREETRLNGLGVRCEVRLAV